jgi:hypothetical protein
MPDAESLDGSPVPPRPASAQERLDERYGRTRGDHRRTRAVTVAAAAAFVVIFGAWVVWGGLSGTNATLEVRELGYQDATSNSITVKWEVSVAPGTEVSCAIQALNASFGIVGWRIVDLGASDQRTRIFSESVRTAEPAVTGLPYRCWLP